MKVLVISLLALFLALSLASADELGLLKDRLRAEALGLDPVTGAAPVYDAAAVQRIRDSLAALNSEGAWPDVVYNCTQRGGWRTTLHLTKLNELARAWATPGCPLEGDEALLKGIQKALGYWLKNDFKSPNWWYNEIWTPREIGRLYVVLGPALTQQEFEQGTGVIMMRSGIRMTGQNKIWLAANTFVRGVLTGDEQLVRDSIEAISGEVVITTSEGIQPDYSFHQHGPQQQFGNYGLAFASESARWIGLVAGTGFAYSPEKVAIIRDYVLQGEAWVCWRGYMDFSSCGRQLGPNAQRGKGRAVSGVAQTMLRLDPEQAADYQAVVARNQPGAANDLVGTRYFWRSDYLIHRQGEWMASLKLSSNRTIGAEALNSENVRGYYTGDGATFFYLTGDEYEAIRPVMDWAAIPGTTLAQTQGKFPWQGNARVPVDFAGAVSTGQVGVAALDYARDGVSARKSWIFLPDCVMALGAGIRASEAVTEPIATTLDQRELRGEVWAGSEEQAQMLEEGSHTLPVIRWVWHDGIGYIFPGPATVEVFNQPASGKWTLIEDKITMPQEEVTAPLFRLALDHGVDPQAAAYAYLVLPGVTREETAERAEGLGVTLLANRPKLQAARAAGGTLVAAVFWDAGSLEYAPGKRMTASEACIVALDLAEGKLWACDPTQQLKQLTLTVAGAAYEVTLPQGGEAGSTVEVDLD